MSETDVMKMKVADLKRELRLRGLPITGNKTELQERLQSALIDGELSLEDTGISEDLLDEDGLTDEEEKGVLDSPTNESVLISPTPPKSDEKSRTTSSSSQQNPIQSKKIILKRKSSLPKLTSITESSLASGSSGGNINSTTESLTIIKDNSVPSEKILKLDVQGNKESNSNSTGGDLSEQKKVIKISELSLKDRLEMRAKKFGLSANGGTKISIDNEKDDAQTIQTLKKRAERFGCVVSSKIAAIEIQEKMLKRQERFGGGGSINNVNDKLKNTSTENTYAEKAKLRLERFKTTPK